MDIDILGFALRIHNYLANITPFNISTGIKNKHQIAN